MDLKVFLCIFLGVFGGIWGLYIFYIMRIDNYIEEIRREISELKNCGEDCHARSCAIEETRSNEK